MHKNAYAVSTYSKQIIKKHVLIFERNQKIFVQALANIGELKERLMYYIIVNYCYHCKIKVYVSESISM